MREILTQKDDIGKKYIIALTFRSSNNVKSNFLSFEGEALAIVWPLDCFRSYLYSQCFILVINHQSLKWLIELDKLISKLKNKIFFIREYNLEIVYWIGINNLDTNGLFYNPCPSKEDLIINQWYRNYNWEAILTWHATTYLTLMSNSTSMVLGQNLDEKLDKNQVISNI